MRGVSRDPKEAEQLDATGDAMMPSTPEGDAVPFDFSAHVVAGVRVLNERGVSTP